MANIPYLGSKISLISKSEIRYEGILYAIDAKESTVTLAKVHSLGTEGRPTERPVAPRDEVYEYIIFRAGDIKDLHVCEPPKALQGLPHDPAIVQHSPPIQYSCGSGLCGLAPFQAHYTPSLPHLLAHYNNAGSTSTHPRKNTTSDAGVQTMEQQQQRVRSLPQQQRGPMPNRRTDQARRGMQRRGMRGRSGGSRPDLLQFEGEYDFEQANQEFQQLESKLTKTRIEDNTQSNPVEDDKAAAYDRKKSFFDEISCEAIQRSKGLVRFDWRVERKLNVVTFGVMANNAWMRRRRMRGGGPRRNFRSRQQPQKTVTFDETPSIQELEPESTEQPPLPVIEVIVEKEGEKDWPAKEGEKVWK